MPYAVGCNISGWERSQDTVSVVISNVMTEIILTGGQGLVFAKTAKKQVFISCITYFYYCM